MRFTLGAPRHFKRQVYLLVLDGFFGDADSDFNNELVFDSTKPKDMKRLELAITAVRKFKAIHHQIEDHSALSKRKDFTKSEKTIIEDELMRHDEGGYYPTSFDITLTYVTDTGMERMVNIED